MAKEPIDMKKNLQNIWLDMHSCRILLAQKKKTNSFGN